MPRELLIMQNSFQWGTAEGQTLEIENAIKSNARDLKIEGQTYQNLLSESKALDKYVYNSDTGEYTLTNPTSGVWNAMAIKYVRPIQEGEKLLIRVNIIKNTIESTQSPPLKITFSNSSQDNTGYININSGVTGLIEHYCNGVSINDEYKSKIEIATRNYSSGELVIKDIQVIPVSTNPLSYTDKTKEYVSTKSEFNYLYVLENLKANTTYTLSYEIKSSNKITTNDKTTLFRIEKVTPDSNTIIKAGFTGTVDNIYRKHNLTFDTESNTKQIKINLRNQFNASSIGLAENTLSVRNLVLLEGDYTNKAMITELPTSINGIESVAERESKNLFKDEGWINKHLNYSDNTLRCSNNFRLQVELNADYTVNFETNNPNLQLTVNGFNTDGNWFIAGFNSDWLNKNQMPYSFKITNPEVKSIGFMFRYKNNEPISPTSSDVLNSNITVTEVNKYPVRISQSHNETDGIVLPNGVTNTIENGVYLQNVYKFIIDENAQMWTGAWDNQVNTIGFNIVLPYNRGVDGIISSYLTAYVNNSFTTDREEIHCTGTRCRLRILRSKLETEDIAGFKKFLKSNPITIYYALATPITQPLTLTEIPLPQPLRSLPNGVCDEVVGNKLIQRVGKYTCTGNETIVLEYNGGLARFKITIKDYKPNLQSIRRLIISDKFTSTTASENYVGLAFSYYACIYIYLEQTIKTVDSCKQWLLENKPTFYYELETPIVHEITQPIIPISKGENMVTTINNIQPNLKFKYKKSKK